MFFERYDRIVDHYETSWPLLVTGYTPILAAMESIVRARPQPPTQLLDLGCGPASATAAVAAACAPAARVRLIDGSAKMLARAQERLGEAVLAASCADFSLPGVIAAIAPEASCDLVLSSFALHHLDDATKRGVLDATAHALAPGGVLLLADEVVADRPAGWDVVGRVRARFIEQHLAAQHIHEEFLGLEASLPPEYHLPFRPCRTDDLVSWMARVGLAASCPVSIFGAALLVGVKRS